MYIYDQVLKQTQKNQAVFIMGLSSFLLLSIDCSGEKVCIYIIIYMCIYTLKDL